MSNQTLAGARSAASRHLISAALIKRPIAASPRLPDVQSGPRVSNVRRGASASIAHRPSASAKSPPPPGTPSPSPKPSNERRRLPSEVTDDYWLYSEGGPRAPSDGKWMLFYSRELVDEAWELAQELYASGQLPGVAAMKVATARSNPRATDQFSRPIIFYCGWVDDEEYTVSIGRRILAAMNYKGGGNVTPYAYYVYWKSDDQSWQGTAATGQARNWTFRIPY